MSLSGSIRVSSTFTNTKTGVDLSTPSERIAETISKDVASGVVYHDTVTLTPSQVYTLDFGDNSLTDVYGATIALTTVTSLYIKAATGNSGDITITNSTNSFLNEQPALSAGEGIGLACDIDVSVDSKLYVTDDGNAGSFDVIVTGTE